jgi:hypothetical protein
MANLVGVYASFILKKIIFHYENPAFEGLFSLETAFRNSQISGNFFKLKKN